MTRHAAEDANPSFSPDGRELVSSSVDEHGRLRVFLLELETGVQRLLAPPSP